MREHMRAPAWHTHTHTQTGPAPTLGGGAKVGHASRFLTAFRESRGDAEEMAAARARRYLSSCWGGVMQGGGGAGKRNHPSGWLIISG